MHFKHNLEAFSINTLHRHENTLNRYYIVPFVNKIQLVSNNFINSQKQLCMFNGKFCTYNIPTKPICIGLANQGIL